MRREDIRKLLGGYAPDVLTPAERKALFDAAMEDQALFDSLADEQALKEVLDDPACRARLASALEPQRQGVWAWLRRPGIWSLAGTLAGTALIAVVLTRSSHAPLSRPELAIRAPLPGAPAAAPPPATMAPAPHAEPVAVRAKAERREQRPQAAARTGEAGGVPGAARRELPAQAAGQTGVVGGVPGGVIGGIIGAPRNAVPPEPPPMAAARKTSELPVPAVAAPPTQAEDVAVVEQAPVSRFGAAADQTSKAPLRSAAFVARAPLSYRVQKRAEGGIYSDAAPAELRAGDPIRLAVAAQPGGYLYVLWRAGSGNWRLLFPSEIDREEANKLEPRREMIIPAEDGWKFDAAPGEKQVLLILTPLPEPGFKTGPLEPLVARMRGGPARERAVVGGGLGMTRRAAAAMGTGGAQPAQTPPAVVTELTLNFL